MVPPKTETPGINVNSPFQHNASNVPASPHAKRYLDIN